MNDVSETEKQEESAAEQRRGGRRLALRFLIVFVVTVLVFLGGYRLLDTTVASDGYLFMLAQHTAFALDLVGHNAELEGDAGRYFAPARKRAEMAAWEAGQDAPPADADYTAEFSDAPLSRWEQWRYRALSVRERQEDREVGPKVNFVLTPGIETEIREAAKALEALAAQEAGPASETRKQLQETLGDLRQRQREIVRLPESEQAELRARTFVFQVVPSCGAIEIIAIFVAAVLAFPATWRRRILGLLIGIPVLYLVNVFRLACLGVIGAWFEDVEVFTFAHEYVWQSIFIIFVVVAWLFWVEVGRKRRD